MIPNSFSLSSRWRSLLAAVTFASVTQTISPGVLSNRDRSKSWSSASLHSRN